MVNKFLFLIPARSGSKGIFNKNIRNFCGKPLMAWTIEEAKKSKYCNALVLSSDSDEYLEFGRKYGCDFTIKRPEYLSTDSASSVDVMIHAIDEFPGYDYVVLLQPTSPLRKVEDIDGAIELIINSSAESCVSISQTKSSPFWMYKISNETNNISALINENDIYRRQELPTYYELNGAIYINKIQTLKEKKKIIDENTVGYIMNQSRSYDIDSEDDWLISKMLFRLENDISED